MKISNSNLNALNRWELFQFLDDVLIFAESHDEGMPELFTNKLAELRTTFDIFDDALVQERNTSPQGLIEAEEKRDHAVRKIYSIVKEYSNYPFQSLFFYACSNALHRYCCDYKSGSQQN